jgi:hypothetical protein
MFIDDYFKETRIWDERLVLVEGRDDDDFLQALCEQIPISRKIQILFYRPHGEISACLKLLVRDVRFENVHVIGMTRDADDGAEPANQSLNSAWENASAILQAEDRLLPLPFFFALPDNRSKGKIEDLCIASPTHPEVLACAEEMYRCASASVHPSDRPKSVVAAYLAMMNRPLRLGVGAQKGYWNLDSEAMGPLRSFLRQIGEA